MESPSKTPKKGGAFGFIVFTVCALVVFGLGLLASSVMERRGEAVEARLQFMKPIKDFEADNKIWGENFPREYASWEATKLETGEEEKESDDGPRNYLEGTPELVVMFAGNSFSKEYNQPRGHYWAIKDVTSTPRVDPEKTPATCLTCKSPDVPRVMNRDGEDKFYAAKFKDYVGDIKNPIGCGDCHNNKTMALQISRPALKEAYESMGKDVNKSSVQEMRTLVCAQCHVSYYFKDKKTNKLVFPWKDGLTADDFDKYFEKDGFVEWVHPISGAKMVKTRHPDFEVYEQGIHAYRGVSCADCHMPYMSEGGVKFTDHRIRKPSENVANSCQVCHRWSEDDVKNRIRSIQTKHKEVLKNACDAITAAHLEIGDATRLGATDAELENVRHTIRRAQLYWDYVASSNGSGFHAPQECARVLDKALNLALQCRLEANRIRAKHGATDAFVMPDLSTKEKALAYVKPFVDAAKAKAAH
jgi:nitrite reductase (cytochrome c-552)